MARKASRFSSASSGDSSSAANTPAPKLPLRETVKQSILVNVFQASEKYVLENGSKFNTQGWMVLVVDPESLRVISSSVGMYNLMEHHVSIVEDLMKSRAPFRNQAALYFIEPTKESIFKLVEDWTPSKEKKGPLYGDIVFLYFLGPLSEELFAVIKECKELVKRIKILKEVNLDFLTKEADAFHFDMKENSLFKKLYLTDPSSPSKVMNKIVTKLVTVCATLNEYPHVRFPAENKLCKTLAFAFQDKMNDFVGSNDSWWYHGDAFHQNEERSTLILLDRRGDCLSPLIHEFTYEAMVNDLLPIEDDRITYESSIDAKEGESGEGTKKMDALLNDNDEVWVELRGKHIADVIQTLSARIRDIVNSSTGSALNSSGKSSGKALSVNQMAKALKALPEYKELMSKLSQHMQIAHQCMDEFNKQSLLELSELEQTFATGETDEGRTPKVTELLGQVVEQFRSQKDSIMRLRLLAIAIVSQRGLTTQSDLEKLLSEAHLNSKETKAVQNLEKMGCPLVMSDEAKNNGKLMSKLRDRRATPFGAGAIESDSEYSSSRYACLIKQILVDATAGTLNVEEYPSVMPLPDPEMSNVNSAKSKVTSVRKAGTSSSKWSKQSTGSDKSGKKKSHGARQIVFTIGGMCYSELRTAREVAASTGTDIVVGSTRFIKPSDFLADLLRLG
mmetsp:Transcript_13272/g.27859  ORF Transcript_13272/g.27859 Transcript_13272/m.27859 type:complete len:676 (+) Transcript_13272:213-2240(+)